MTAAVVVAAVVVAIVVVAAGVVVITGVVVTAAVVVCTVATVAAVVVTGAAVVTVAVGVVSAGKVSGGACCSDNSVTSDTSSVCSGVVSEYGVVFSVTADDVSAEVSVTGCAAVLFMGSCPHPVTESAIISAAIISAVFFI